MVGKKRPSSFQTKVKAGRETLNVTVDIDSRLRKSARWTLKNDVLHLRVPGEMSDEQIEKILADIAARIGRQRKRARRQSDDDLMERANALNRQYFGSELSWHTVRWVTNMNHRLGSCTTGGPTDGDIRISERMRNWPPYVVDYVLAHEICHRKYPNHSQAFWDYLGRYPLVQKALGFIEGIAYAEGSDPEDLLD